MVSACSTPVETKTPVNLLHAAKEDPTLKVTQINIYKSKHRMDLMQDDKILKSYKMDLGFAPTGDKKQQGDGKTPEGRYYIDRKNAQSQYYLSLGVSYPNASDRREAAKMGVSPGGDIFIHGQGPWGQGRGGTDWTRGCIAVTDVEMYEVFHSVPLRTPIEIRP
jgi:murein L,D-transpeptidase YafK